LLASFIIIPVAQLVILESLIMFWGQYSVLWYIVIGLVVTSALLLRMGIHLFNREELLGREFDVLNLAWVGRVVRSEFGAGAHSLREWTRSFLPMGMMAGGDLGVILATKSGPVSVVTPLTGAYPLVTLGFAALALKEKVSRLQWVCIAMILAGMVLSPGASG